MGDSCLSTSKGKEKETQSHKMALKNWGGGNCTGEESHGHLGKTVSGFQSVQLFSPMHALPVSPSRLPPFLPF